MKKVKYEYKRYIKYVLLILFFTAAQVIFSTLIPKYTARNINIGIAQSGIEYAIFDKVSKEKAIYLNSEILENYELKDGMYILKDGVNKEKLEEKMIGSMKISKKGIIEIIKKENEKNGINNSTNFIIQNSKIMFLFAIGSAIFITLSNISISYTVALITKRLREKVFNKVQNFSNNNLSKFGVSSLITRTTNDLSKIQDSMNMLLKICLLAPMIMVFSSYQAYALAPEIMPVLSYLIIAVLLVICIALYFILPKISEKQKIVDELNNITREILTGKRVIRAFRKQDFETEKYEEVNKKSKILDIYINVIASLVNPLVDFILNISAVIILYYVAIKVDKVFVGVGTIIAFIQYAINIIMSFIIFSQIFFVIPTAMISFKRIDEILNEDTSIENNAGMEKLEKIEKIEFVDVEFRYEGSESNVLENINFDIARNEFIGIIGSTGSGKSTISKLMLRFVDKTKGKILINSKDITEYDLESLRSRISYTPQSSKLLSGTVLENIAFNDNNPDISRVKQAIEYAKATEFAELDRKIEQGGSNLSGGQKQRIQIARSIYKDSDLMVFDDSFSALDNKTDSEIRKNISNLNRMKIIIAQKISTIINADKIIVLNDGDIVGIGKHDELLKNCVVYRQIYETQTGGTL